MTARTKPVVSTLALLCVTGLLAITACQPEKETARTPGSSYTAQGKVVNVEQATVEIQTFRGDTGRVDPYRVTGQTKIFVEDADGAAMPGEASDLHPGQWVRFTWADPGSRLLRVEPMADPWGRSSAARPRSAM